MSCSDAWAGGRSIRRSDQSPLVRSLAVNVRRDDNHYQNPVLGSSGSKAIDGSRRDGTSEIKGPVPNKMSSRTEPKVSVVVTAFRRHSYIAEAIRSALDSAISPESFEVILVADALPSELRGTIEGWGVRIFDSDTPFVGETLATGIAEARGEVVSFLDDDDRFHPDKVGTVVREFAEPSLLYFHHGFRRVREDGRPFPVRTEIRPIRTWIPLPLTRSDAGRVRRAGGYLNKSSIAVRRSALLPQLPILRRISNADDFSMLLLVGGRGYALLDGTKVLTDYRTHPSMGRHRFEDGRLPPAHLRYLEGTARSFDLLQRHAPSPGGRGFSECRTDSYETLLWTTTGVCATQDLRIRRRALRAVVGNLGERDPFNALVLAALLVLSVFSRSWPRQLYVHLVRIEGSGLGLSPG